MRRAEKKKKGKNSTEFAILKKEGKKSKRCSSFPYKRLCQEEKGEGKNGLACVAERKKKRRRIRRASLAVPCEAPTPERMGGQSRLLGTRENQFTQFRKGGKEKKEGGSSSACVEWGGEERARRRSLPFKRGGGRILGHSHKKEGGGGCFCTSSIGKENPKREGEKEKEKLHPSLSPTLCFERGIRQNILFLLSICGRRERKKKGEGNAGRNSKGGTRGGPALCRAPRRTG